MRRNTNHFLLENENTKKPIETPKQKGMAPKLEMKENEILR